MKKNNLTTIFVSMFFLLSVISFTSAVAIGGPPMENKQLVLFSGESRNLEFTIQNGGGATEAVNVKVNVIEGSDIIKLVEEENIYLVSPGDMVPIGFLVTAPNGVAGSKYEIVIEFSEASANQDALSFGTGINQEFEVVLAEQPEETEKNKELKGWVLMLWIGIFILLIIIVLVVILRKRKTR